MDDVLREDRERLLAVLCYDGPCVRSGRDAAPFDHRPCLVFFRSHFLKRPYASIAGGDRMPLSDDLSSGVSCVSWWRKFLNMTDRYIVFDLRRPLDEP